MPQRSLAEFLEQLAHCGQLVRVSTEVDGRLEIAEITRRVAAEQGPALLFERVRGQGMAVVTNLLGTPGRAALALGLESLDQLGPRVEALVREHTPQNWFDRLRMSDAASGAEKFRTKSAKSGACQQVVRLGRDMDLAALPLLTSWPEESAASLSAGLIVSAPPGGGPQSLTHASLADVDSQQLAVIDDGHSTFASHLAAHRAANQKMPLAIILGGDPATLVTAQLELTDEADAFQAIGLVRGAPLDVVKCRTHDLQVPADADVVLEGYWDPHAADAEVHVAAPGGSHYRPRRKAPVVQLSAITHRTHPAWPAIVDGQTGERAVLATIRERALLSIAQSVAPEVVDLHVPPLGGADRFVVVAIEKRRPFHARHVAAALWGARAVGRAKFLIVVDRAIDLRDLGQVWTAVGAQVAPERDLLWFDGPAGGSDDANTLGPLSRHVAIDATRKIAGECPVDTPAVLAASREIIDLVSSRWAEYKLFTGNPG